MYPKMPGPGQGHVLGSLGLDAHSVNLSGRRGEAESESELRKDDPVSSSTK